jgi:hypothetical protein
MSVYLWSDGRDWWTGAGYWLYGTEGRRYAESWNGANAPHLERENTYQPNGIRYDSDRATSVCGYGCIDSLAVIDLQRVGPGGYRVRRQVVKLSDFLWVVLDADSGETGSNGRTVWTASHDLRVREGVRPGAYILDAGGPGRTMDAEFFGPAGTRVKSFSGSTKPFLGWQAYNREAMPTTSIVVERPPGNSWSAAVWFFHDGASGSPVGTEAPRMELYEGPANWRMNIPLPSRDIVVARERSRVVVDLDETSKSVVLDAPPRAGIHEQRRMIRSSFETAASRYPTFRTALTQRSKITLLLLSVFLAQEIFFLVYRKITKRYYVLLRVINNLCWVLGGVWLLTIYIVN